VAYVGTHGSHLFRDRLINSPTPGPGAINPRRPYYGLTPQIQTIRLRASDGNSSYNSLQLKYTKRMATGLSVIASYTWANSIDNQNIFYIYNDQLNRGPSNSKSTDLRHNFTAGYNYELPFGRGRQWLSSSSRLVDALAGGWTVNGITVMHTGDPLVMTTASSLLNTGTTNRANVSCNGVPLVKHVDQWFDTNCFTAPAQYVLGNAGKGIVRGPGLVNFDLSGFKKFAIDEKRALEFRAEFFNVANNTHFADPGMVLGNGNFGRITSTILTLREVQLGLKLFF